MRNFQDHIKHHVPTQLELVSAVRITVRKRPGHLVLPADVGRLVSSVPYRLIRVTFRPGAFFFGVSLPSSSMYPGQQTDSEVASFLNSDESLTISYVPSEMTVLDAFTLPEVIMAVQLDYITSAIQVGVTFEFVDHDDASFHVPFWGATLRVLQIGALMHVPHPEGLLDTGAVTNIISDSKTPFSV